MAHQQYRFLWEEFREINSQVIVDTGISRISGSRHCLVDKLQ